MFSPTGRPLWFRLGAVTLNLNWRAMFFRISSPSRRMAFFSCFIVFPFFLLLSFRGCLRPSDPGILGPLFMGACSPSSYLPTYPLRASIQTCPSFALLPAQKPQQPPAAAPSLAVALRRRAAAAAAAATAGLCRRSFALPFSSSPSGLFQGRS